MARVAREQPHLAEACAPRGDRVSKCGPAAPEAALAPSAAHHGLPRQAGTPSNAEHARKRPNDPCAGVAPLAGTPTLRAPAGRKGVALRGGCSGSPLKFARKFGEKLKMHSNSWTSKYPLSSFFLFCLILKLDT